jgi:hypothetical protein
MDGSSDRREDRGLADGSGKDAAPSLSRRRLLCWGKRAAFVVPVVWTLTASQALAAGSNPSATPSCLGTGELCSTDSDCCSGKCKKGVCK